MWVHTRRMSRHPRGCGSLESSDHEDALPPRPPVRTADPGDGHRRLGAGRGRSRGSAPSCAPPLTGELPRRLRSPRRRKKSAANARPARSRKNFKKRSPGRKPPPAKCRPACMRCCAHRGSRSIRRRAPISSRASAATSAAFASTPMRGRRPPPRRCRLAPTRSGRMSRSAPASMRRQPRRAVSSWPTSWHTPFSSSAEAVRRSLPLRTAAWKRAPRPRRAS